ncbi:P-loop containing nucleoside triphosphate hydrolase protein [Flammula alnicola]|nr:P-loop containing nucleoside triphosphate hydrolase protein [Flammula alnicola]
MSHFLHARISILRFLRVSGHCYSTTRENIWKDSHAAAFFAAAKTIASIPKSTGLPEIIVTGRANAGKSTLLNAVLGRKTLLSTSKKAGHTKALNFYRIGAEPGKLLLVDAPGYGARGRPEWGALFDHYVQKRVQLRRIYILFNAKHGLNEFDVQMLSHLSTSLLTARGTQPFTLQSVITKADLVPVGNLAPVIEKMRKDIWEAAPLCLPPLITSAGMSPPFGLELVRQNIVDACGL